MTSYLLMQINNEYNWGCSGYDNYEVVSTIHWPWTEYKGYLKHEYECILDIIIFALIVGILTGLKHDTKARPLLSNSDSITVKGYQGKGPVSEHNPFLRPLAHHWNHSSANDTRGEVKTSVCIELKWKFREIRNSKTFLVLWQHRKKYAETNLYPKKRQRGELLRRI